MALTLGRPRLHLVNTSSTNDRARDLALAGAPHGTVVTAGSQTAGRGRQGRTWSAPPGKALLLSVIVHRVETLLPLRTGLAVADVAGPEALVKWPNDVLLDGRKVAGVLVEGRPAEGWAVIGIGLNVALEPDDFPPELRETATSLGRSADQLEPTLEELLDALERRLEQPEQDALTALRARDALRGNPVSWANGHGEGAGIDDGGGLIVALPSGTTVVLEAGEVHLRR